VNRKEVSRDYADYAETEVMLGECARVRVEYLPLSSSAHRMLQRSIAPTQRLMIAAVAILAISIGACTSQEQKDKEATPVLSGPPSTTFPMPPLSARTELGWVLNDGKHATLADYQGKVLVLDLYATW
jgi:hypothetical protein